MGVQLTVTGNISHNNTHTVIISSRAYYSQLLQVLNFEDSVSVIKCEVLGVVKVFTQHCWEFATSTIHVITYARIPIQLYTAESCGVVCVWHTCAKLLKPHGKPAYY